MGDYLSSAHEPRFKELHKSIQLTLESGRVLPEGTRLRVSEEWAKSYTDVELIKDYVAGERSATIKYTHVGRIDSVETTCDSFDPGCLIIDETGRKGYVDY